MGPRWASRWFTIRIVLLTAPILVLLSYVLRHPESSSTIRRVGRYRRHGVRASSSLGQRDDMVRRSLVTRGMLCWPGFLLPFGTRLTSVSVIISALCSEGFEREQTAASAFLFGSKERTGTETISFAEARSPLSDQAKLRCLERTRPKLNITRRIRSTDLAKSSAGNGGAWVTPVGPIENIECVHLNCQAHAFSGQTEAFTQRQVPRVVARADDVADWRSSGAAVCLLRKGIRIEPTLLARRAGVARIERHAGYEVRASRKGRDSGAGRPNRLRA